MSFIDVPCCRAETYIQFCFIFVAVSLSKLTKSSLSFVLLSILWAFWLSNLALCLGALSLSLCETRENPIFSKMGKIVILIKTQNFSRSWMTKQTYPLKSSREIW